MRTLKFLRLISRSSTICILPLLVSSCMGVSNPINNTLAEFDRAINSLENESANWRKVVQDLQASTQETISGELTDFAENTINAAGAEMRCNATFINEYTGYEVQKKILQKRNELAQSLGVSARTIPAPTPVICNAVPGEIQLKGNQPQTASIEFYGYYLDPNRLQIIAELNASAAREANIDNPDSLKVINRELAGGQFDVSINLGQNGISGNLLKVIDRIILKNNNQDIYSIHVIHTRAEPTQARVTVNFRSVYIEDDADPAGSAEVDFTFRVNSQTQTWSNSNASTGSSYSVNKQFQTTLSKEDTLSIFVNGVDRDAGWIDEDDPLGEVNARFAGSRNWGAGSHSIRSSCPDGCYTVNFDVDVDWIE